MNPEVPPAPQSAEEMSAQVQRAFTEMQQLNARLQQLSTELQATKAELEQTKAENRVMQAGGGGMAQAKPNKPTPFKGDSRTNVEAWLSQMDMYVQ